MTSRVEYNDWADGNGDLDRGRWERNTRATIESKRGQTVLRELEAALVALPGKQLACGTFAERDESGHVNVCVLGAYALHKGVTTEGAYHFDDADEMAGWATRKDGLAMAYTLAWNLIERNDEIYDLHTPEQRYERMLAWVRSQIK